MRTALIADIHGNTVALDAVLADLDGRGVDQVVCLGDVAANGPDPRGAIDRLRDLGCVTVQGNVDAGTVAPPDVWRDPSLRGIPEALHPGIAIGVWSSEVVDEDQRGWLAALPLTAEVALGGSTLLAFHGSPRSYDDYLTATTPDDELEAMFAETRAPWLAGGHTHVPLLRRWGERTIVNPGSVGLPFARYGAAGAVPVTGRADYAIVTADADGVHVEHRQVPIDLDALAASVRASEMPHADWWLRLWPSADL